MLRCLFRTTNDTFFNTFCEETSEVKIKWLVVLTNTADNGLI